MELGTTEDTTHRCSESGMVFQKSMRTITSLAPSRLLVPCVQITISFLIALLCAGYRIYHGSNVGLGLFPHSCRRLWSCITNDIVCLGQSFLKNIVWRRIAYRISSWRNCSVLLYWCRDPRAEPRAQNLQNLRIASGRDSRKQYDATWTLTSQSVMRHLGLHGMAE